MLSAASRRMFGGTSVAIRSARGRGALAVARACARPLSTPASRHRFGERVFHVPVQRSAALPGRLECSTSTANGGTLPVAKQSVPDVALDAPASAFGVCWRFVKGDPASTVAMLAAVGALCFSVMNYSDRLKEEKQRRLARESVVAIAGRAFAGVLQSEREARSKFVGSDDTGAAAAAMCATELDNALRKLKQLEHDHCRSRDELDATIVKNMIQQGAERFAKSKGSHLMPRR